MTTKQAMIYKGFESAGATEEDLQKINRYTRRELSADEVYVFPLILCDNEVDRDGERFSIDALHKLRRLFLGKTGIFDHNPKGQNQTARIFSTAVEKDPLRKTQAGEEYHFLTARAYMVRSDKNADLILEIDAGIKKEVSVGCAVEAAVCSICGRNVKERPCEHKVGKTYNGAICHRILERPTDAYEWSFVAVPAQPAAGVTKALLAPGGAVRPDADGLLGRLKAAQAGEALTPGDAAALAGELERLQTLAKAGESYLAQLKRDVLRAAALSGSGIDVKTVSAIADKLNPEELRALKKTFAASGEHRYVPQVQLAGGQATSQPADNAQFLI